MADLADRFKDSVLTRTGLDLRFLRDDVAAIDVRWEMTGARDPLGNEWPVRSGLINLVATRDGTWSIAILHNMDLPDEEMREAQARIRSR
jgi:hypothetical protein